MITETICIFLVLSTHSQSYYNLTVTQNYKNLLSAPTSTMNENSNLALRSIIAVAITGWYGTVINSELDARQI